jgi:phosphoenolpyruvate carboxykinase (ATP)
MATQTKPASGSPDETNGLESQGLKPSGQVHWNLVAPELMLAAARRGEGEFADMGPFVAVTAPHTGRSPNDKFVVKEPSTEADIDWGKVNQPISSEHFETLVADVKEYLNAQPELFIQDLRCGADPAHRLSVRYVLPNAWHAAFVRNMFIRPEQSCLPSSRTSRCCTHRSSTPTRPAMARARARSSCSTSRSG